MFTRVLGIFAIIVALVLPAQAQSAKARAFFVADANQNQTLDEREFASFINFLAERGNFGAKQVRRFGLYDLAWSRVDKNGDGAITVLEVRGAKRVYKEGQTRTAQKLLSKRIIK